MIPLCIRFLVFASFIRSVIFSVIEYSKAKHANPCRIIVFGITHVDLQDFADRRIIKRVRVVEQAFFLKTARRPVVVDTTNEDYPECGVLRQKLHRVLGSRPPHFVERAAVGKREGKHVLVAREAMEFLQNTNSLRSTH